jgi:hypothetical protein
VRTKSLVHEGAARFATGTFEGIELVAIAKTFEAIVEQAGSLEAVRKNDLHSGDRVLVTTRNSLYTILVLGDGLYWVWGGWFDRQGVAPQKVAINGCTWGGSAIKHDIVAAPGLRLEFGNTVLTTRIRHVRMIRAEAQFSRN